MKQKIINGKAYTIRTKGLFQIEHNGILYSLGETTSGPALKKAHRMVRNYIINQWANTRCNVETTAIVKADGQRYCSVYGVHKNRAIQSITLS